MVNSQEFIKRLQIILGHYQLSAAALADHIQVQRSSISHLLSGRNKPSLEFVLKVVKTYPEVNIYWLLNGEGSFPSNKESSSPLQEIKAEPAHSIISPKPEPPLPIRDSINTLSLDENEIEQIIIFYKKGHFKVYKP